MLDQAKDKNAILHSTSFVFLPNKLTIQVAKLVDFLRHLSGGQRKALFQIGFAIEVSRFNVASCIFLGAR